MNGTIKTVGFLASGLVLLVFTLLVINQTAQVVELADRLHPAAGQATLVILLTTYTVLLVTPLVLYARLPRSLDPPENEDDPGYPVHLERLRQRLLKNPRVVEKPLAADRESLERAIKPLNEEADRIIHDAARLIFLSTAISQFGKFDAMVVLTVQSRMVWKIAHLYNQRPTARDLARLYANVAGTAFAAGALDEADLNEVVQPVLSTALGGVAGAVPGLQAGTTLLVGSVMTGTANAYLTLRVGLIARSLCGAIVLKPRAELRRSAAREAAARLGEIVRSGTSRILGAFYGGVRKWGSQTAENMQGKMMDVVSSVGSYAGRFRRGPADSGAVD